MDALIVFGAAVWCAPLMYGYYRFHQWIERKFPNG